MIKYKLNFSKYSHIPPNTNSTSSSSQGSGAPITGHLEDEGRDGQEEELHCMCPRTIIMITSHKREHYSM